jgi:hypothetical protein
MARGRPPVTALPKFGFIRLRNREQRSLLLPTAVKVTEPLPAFAAAARNLGHVNILSDLDGIVRREALVLAYQDNFYASMPCRR